MSDQSKNIGHASRIGNIGWAIVILLGIGTGFSLMALGFLGNLIGGLLLAGCLAGWLTLGGYWLLNKAVIDPAGNAIGRILVQSGGSTPSVAQHSNIETMEARGQYAEAARAYRAVIAAEPEDLVACDKLAQLALRQLKDYDTALFAYREAEKRTREPKRRLGYAMLIAGIYRDNLKDYGKAMVELRRIMARYPDAPNRARLSAEVDELKALHFEGQ
ncbi:MAG: tol-pal system YbgF family protein [Gemmatimonadales bacterium]